MQPSAHAIALDVIKSGKQRNDACLSRHMPARL